MDQAALDNSREQIGGNVPPDHGKIAYDAMAEKYAANVKTLEELLAEARTAPVDVQDEETAGTLSRLVKRLRDTAGQLIAFHTAEKEPYLRGGQGVDRFFFAHVERAERRKKGDKAGAADILFARVDAYNQAKLRREQAARDAAAAAAKKAEEEATKKRLEEEQAARDAIAAAGRAKKPENIDAHHAAAADHAAAAQTARYDEEAARTTLQDTQIAAAAKPADMVRARIGDDVVLTMQTENYAEVTDHALLDSVALWAFVDDAAKEKALKAWAKTTNYKRQMPGANIGNRPKTVIR